MSQKGQLKVDTRGNYSREETISDDSEPRIFSSARDLFRFSSKLKIGQKQAEIHYHNKLVLKMTKSKSYNLALKTPFLLHKFK